MENYTKMDKYFPIKTIWLKIGTILHYYFL